jgi:hypothetical protein
MPGEDLETGIILLNEGAQAMRCPICRNPMRRVKETTWSVTYHCTKCRRDHEEKTNAGSAADGVTWLLSIGASIAGILFGIDHYDNHHSE